MDSGTLIFFFGPFFRGDWPTDLIPASRSLPKWARINSRTGTRAPSPPTGMGSTRTPLLATSIDPLERVDPVGLLLALGVPVIYLIVYLLRASLFGSPWLPTFSTRFPYSMRTLPKTSVSNPPEKRKCPIVKLTLVVPEICCAFFCSRRPVARDPETCPSWHLMPSSRGGLGPLLHAPALAGSCLLGLPDSRGLPFSASSTFLSASSAPSSPLPGAFAASAIPASSAHAMPVARGPLGSPGQPRPSPFLVAVSLPLLFGGGGKSPP
ncbi:hypothetical protein PAPYR_7030 [Paratrimastix pyriformis]|uniref:Uncharacterized protein n=1 Tax=Paratrimastix pyriformis TaxID=342808 RepID=A0ABQ8UGA3_9EUKA|nr:hypothetical protein PAPYR_7030 [Paratrimastix pyriformis]